MRALMIGSIVCVLTLTSPKIAWAGEDSPAASHAAASDAASSNASVNDAAKSPEAASEVTLLEQLLQQRDAQYEQERALNAEQQRRLTTLESELATIQSSAASPAPTSISSPSVAGSDSQTKNQSGSGDTAPLFFRIGKANFTPGGFIDFTTVFRTKAVGSGIATTFGTIPYKVASSFPAAGLSELRMSAQNSRFSLRVDSNVGETKVYGYVETDLLGNNASTMYVTSNSATLRLRAAFPDLGKGKWELLAGQDWSLLTPNRKGLSPMTSDVFYSIDADSNYQLGVVWARQAQLRAVYHFNSDWALGLALENPQQFTGSALTLPAAFASTQVDTNGASWGASTNTPNLHPDLIAKVAYDTKVKGKAIHIDAAGLYRAFKVNTFVAGTGSAAQVDENSTAPGGGASFNSNFELFKNFHLIENAYWSDGGGRYILGLAPDFVVRPANSQRVYTISPVHAGSGLLGVEWQASPKVMLYSYYSGIYISRDYFVVGANTVCGTSAYCGYGFPGSSNANNRDIQEATIGISRTIWSSAELGKAVVHTQISYLQRYPWAVAAGTPKDANLMMAYAAFKYVLP